MKYEPIIGLEVHVQLATRTKMFCRCSADTFGKPPNSYTCPVCLGLPGALPVTNSQAVKLALLAGEAFGSKHPPVSKFDRKNYFYPDLPKGYQISQYDLPLNIGGEVIVDGGKIALTRAHLEEDTGKLLHQEGKTLIDFNRSGVPLLEVVTEPVIKSASQARAVGQKIQLLMRYAGVSEADMEKGSLRVDANVSMMPTSSKKFGTKVEVKNMNSFRSVEKALSFEIERQTKLLEKGEKVIQETRGWMEGKGITVTQRVKEEAEDYRYFPEPDLPAIEISKEILAELKLPEMPDAKKSRWIKQYKLIEKYADVLVSGRDFADHFEHGMKILEIEGKKHLANEYANLIVNKYLAFGVASSSPEHTAKLFLLFSEGKISASSVGNVMAEMVETGKSPDDLIKEKGLTLQSDVVKLTQVAEAVVAQNKEAAQDFKLGKVEAFGFLLGKLMKETSGQADPTIARQALERVLQK